jgi:RNA polymerase sigma-70 factor (ECF subfamily)
MITPAQEQKFLALIEEHKKILYKVCYSYCRQAEDRNDLAQEMVIQLWRSFEKYNDQFKFSTWMYRVALNVAISFYRREKTRSRHISPFDDDLLNVIDDSGSPESSEDLELLHRFIQRLDELNKALVLLYLDGNSYKAISDVLGITETNVATKINRIKKKLGQDFAENP